MVFLLKIWLPFLWLGDSTWEILRSHSQRVLWAHIDPRSLPMWGVVVTAVCGVVMLRTLPGVPRHMVPAMRKLLALPTVGAPVEKMKENQQDQSYPLSVVQSGSVLLLFPTGCKTLASSLHMWGEVLLECLMFILGISPKFGAWGKSQLLLDSDINCDIGRHLP